MVNQHYFKVSSYFVILFLILFTYSLNCKPKIYLETNALIKINYHTGNFTGFPGYDCCGNFSNSVGFGYSLSIGGLQNNLFYIGKTNFGIFVELGYNFTNGKFIEEEYFADVIIGNYIGKGISKHTLDASVNSFELIPGFRTSNLFGIKPLFIKLAPGFRLPLNSNFKQQEELISPKEATFENGTRIRNSYSGKIPQLTSPVVFANLQVGWETFSFKTLTFSPVISFSYALNKNVRNLNWRTHSFSIGLNIRYTLPKPKPSSPIQPPTLDLPKPIELKPQLPLQAKLLIESTNERRIVKNFDTIEVVKTINKIIEHKPTPAIIFYRKNDFLFGNDTIPTSFEFEQLYSENRKIVGALLDYLKQNKDISLTIVCSQTEDELPNISDLRITRVVEFLRSNGFSDRIKEVKKINIKPKKPIPELFDELRYVQFIFNNNGLMISTENIIKSDTVLFAPKLNIQTLVEEKNQLKVNGKVVFKGKETLFNTKNFLLDLNQQPIDFDNGNDSIYIKIRLETIEELPRQEEIESTIYVSSIIKDTTSYTYLNPFHSQTSILAALFNFDESEFYWKNPKLKDIITDLQKQGKKISIVGSVDNIGSEEHNQKLALARAKRVQNVVGPDIPIKAIETSKSNGNKTPLQRILNRSAWLVVE